MSTLFETFPESADIDYTPNAGQNPSVQDDEWRCNLEKRLLKQEKKIQKLKKKEKKLHKRITDLKEQQVMLEAQNADNERALKQSHFKEWSGIIKKAIPSILSVVSALVNGIFSSKRKTT